MAGAAGAVWGLGGVLLLLGSAIYRLTPLAIEGFSHHFLWYHWMTLVFVVLSVLAFTSKVFPYSPEVPELNG